MRILGKRGEAAFSTILHSRILLALRIIASLAGFAVFLWPTATDITRVIAGILALSVASTFAIQFMLRLFHRLPDQVLHTLLARKYGFEYRQLIIKGTLRESDGSMGIHRYIHLRSNIALTHIRHYLHVLVKPAQDSVAIVDLKKVKPPGVDITAAKVPDLSFEDRLVIQVAFDPPLEPGEEAIYEIRELYPPGSFARTSAEMAASNLKYEYLSWDISRPTKHFQLQVALSQSLHPTVCEHDVWYGGGQIHQRHKREWTASQKCFTRHEGEADSVVIQLDKLYPVLGLLYVLKWKYK